MKKLFTIISVCLLATASLLAQGRISFNNSSATPLRISDGSITSVLGTASTAHFGIGPASVRIQLFAGFSSSWLFPVLIGSGANQNYVTNTASASATFQGTFFGGNPLPLAGFDGSQPVYLQFVATAIDGYSYFARSSIIQVTPSLSPNVATSVFSTTADANHWAGLISIPIPEPSTFGLLGLSFSQLLFGRRRK